MDWFTQEHLKRQGHVGFDTSSVKSASSVDTKSEDKTSIITEIRSKLKNLRKSKHCTLRHIFALDYDYPEAFATPACSRLGSFFLLYRVAIAIYFMAIAIHVIQTEYTGTGKWFIYFSNWMFILLTISTSLQAIIAIYHLAVVERRRKRLRKDTGYTGMPKLYKVSWFLNNIIVASAPIVTIAFWAYYHTHNGPLEGYPYGIGSVTKHILDAVHVGINILISSIPLQSRHVIQPLVFHFLYFLFIAFFWAAGGTDYHGNNYIYRKIRFSHNPWWCFAMLVLFVLATIPVYFFWLAVGKMRTYVYKRLGCARRMVKYEKQEKKEKKKRNRKKREKEGRQLRDRLPLKQQQNVKDADGSDYSPLPGSSTSSRRLPRTPIESVENYYLNMAPISISQPYMNNAGFNMHPRAHRQQPFVGATSYVVNTVLGIPNRGLPRLLHIRPQANWMWQPTVHPPRDFVGEIGNRRLHEISVENLLI